MRTLLFANRNIKEILRDPINLFFGLGFPLILLVLMSIINNSIPPEANNPMYEINNLAPGIAMFSTAFMATFVGMVLAKDRSSSFLMRLFTSPMTAVNFILGYTLPMLLIALAQAVVTFTASAFLGLTINMYLLPGILATVLIALLFVGLGMLFGSLINERAVGGVCGALLTNIAAWLSGVFIPIHLIGGVFLRVAQALPFYHGVEMIRKVLAGNIGDALPHMAAVLGYTVVIFAMAVLAFRAKMQGEQG